MKAMRAFSVRHARAMMRLYSLTERLFVLAEPLIFHIGSQRLERPFSAVERLIKGLLFDCRMCGQCVLSQTGMSCPMNCPKQMRNGPCGGVRPGGFCEVWPDRRCVWLMAAEGLEHMGHSDKLALPLPPLDRRLTGRSSFLRVLRLRATAGSRNG
ncbi:MAG: methylenetetrahydrofolate reductase C-terminal domain-containing protein [Rhizobiales bacterium]|nr:methylenetetrahydrofolate reductase C-terminal domain-containing protein [Hyphomicrobiales bacterium]